MATQPLSRVKVWDSLAQTILKICSRKVESTQTGNCKQNKEKRPDAYMEKLEDIWEGNSERDMFPRLSSKSWVLPPLPHLPVY